MIQNALWLVGRSSFYVPCKKESDLFSSLEHTFIEHYDHDDSSW